MIWNSKKPASKILSWLCFGKWGLLLLSTSHKSCFTCFFCILSENFDWFSNSLGILENPQNQEPNCSQNWRTRTGLNWTFHSWNHWNLTWHIVSISWVYCHFQHCQVLFWPWSFWQKGTHSGTPNNCHKTAWEHVPPRKYLRYVDCIKKPLLLCVTPLNIIKHTSS